MLSAANLPRVAEPNEVEVKGEEAVSVVRAIKCLSWWLRACARLPPPRERVHRHWRTMANLQEFCPEWILAIIL